MSDKIEKKQEQPLKAVPEADRGSSGAEGGRSPTGGPSESRRREQRWSARKKQDLVLRLLRGESLDAVSRETGLPVSRIAGWRDASLSAMEHSLKASSHRQRDDLAQDKRELQRKLGEVTMDNELLREKIRKLEEKHPFPRLERGHRLGQFAFTKSTLSGLHAGSLRLVVIHGRVSLLAYRSDKGLESSLLGYASCLEVVVKSARPWLLVAVCLSLAGGAAWGDAVCEVLPRRVRHG